MNTILNILLAIFELLRPLIGKNVASLARSGNTLIGGALIGWSILTFEQTADGIQIQEVLLGVGGLAVIWVSSLINWIRAKTLYGRSLSGLADWLHPILGRSVHSAIRRLGTAVAGVLIFFGLAAPGASEAEVGSMDLVEVLSGIGLWAIGRVYSYIQEGDPESAL